MKKILQYGFLFAIIITFFLLDSLSFFFLPMLPEPNYDELLKNQYQTLEEEYQELLSKQELQIPETKITTSKVLLRDPLEFFETITILKGEEEQITVSSAVVKDTSLIGIVSKTNHHTSKVRLLSNPSTSLSVKIKDTYGILTTNELRENWVNNLTKETTLAVGDEIYTSGLTEVPGGILIGTVETIENDSLGLTKSIKVKRAVEDHDLNYLSIITKEGIE